MNSEDTSKYVRGMASNHEFGGVLSNGGYKTKLTVAKNIIADYQTVVEKLKLESYTRGLLLKKSFSALCEVWVHIQQVTNTPLLHSVFSPEAVNERLISSGTAEEHAEAIVKIAIALLGSAKLLHAREQEVELSIKDLGDSAMNAIVKEPETIPSPIIRSYEMLERALSDMKDYNSKRDSAVSGIHDSDSDDSDDSETEDFKVSAVKHLETVRASLDTSPIEQNSQGTDNLSTKPIPETSSPGFGTAKPSPASTPFTKKIAIETSGLKKEEPAKTFPPLKQSSSKSKSSKK